MNEQHGLPADVIVFLTRAINRLSDNINILNDKLEMLLHLVEDEDE